ncbi:MAG TPA: DUF3795 domain-containing protein [Syntrophomonadaceae bacterium]|nr:DUF3795 domain-containing protein [Syntrophomonadaceae bacterium]
MLSACGILCDACEFFGKSCDGCSKVEGKPFWVAEMMVENCALYQCCVEQKGYSHCGHCSSLPCSMFLDHKDPRLSDEEHALGVKERVARLNQGK